MRLVYIILAHQLPEQLVRLVDRLDARGVRFLIHLDRSMSDEQTRFIRKALAGRPTVEFLPRHRCAWGEFSIVEATLEGVRRCGQLEFDYAVLLSGQDYPIKTHRQIIDYFAGLNGRSVIHEVPFPKPDWKNGGWDRLQGYHMGSVGRPLRWLAAGHARLRLKRRYPPGIHPHGGAQFWALSRDAVVAVLEFVQRRPDFVRAHRYTFAADEMFFQTIVANSVGIDTVNDAINFLEWNREGAVLDSSDFESLRSTYHLYARKFDVRMDAAVLDRIDRVLLSRAPVGPAAGPMC